MKLGKNTFAHLNWWHRKERKKKNGFLHKIASKLVTGQTARNEKKNWRIRATLKTQCLSEQIEQLCIKFPQNSYFRLQSGHKRRSEWT